MESWNSIELQVRQRLVLPSDWSGKPQDFDVVIDHYIETAAGQRFLETRFEKSGIPGFRCADFFDGKRGASLAYNRKDLEKQQQVIIHRHFAMEDRFVQTSRPRPLVWYWVGRRPLHKALRDAQYLGEQQVIGRNCDVFLFERAGGTTGQRDQVYYLDKETSVPLKVEVYRNTEDRRAGRLLQVWTAKELGKVQGYPIIRQAMEQGYTGEGGKLDMTREYHVESVAFNKEFPASTFWPELQSGTTVFDTITNKIVAPVPGPKDVTEKTKPTPTTNPVNAIRAEQPRPWTSYGAPISLALGVAILLTSLLLWRRRA